MDSSTKIYSPRQLRSRNLIVTAANAAFAELGYDEVSMADIATRAGLARMTIYNLFQSKEDIVHAIGYQVAAAAGPHFLARMDAGEDAIALITDAFLGSAQWCLDNPSIAAIALMGPQNKQLAPPEGQASFHAIVRDLFAYGQKQGCIRQDEDPNFLALNLLGGYAQMMLFALAGGPFDMSRIHLLVRLNLEGSKAPDAK